MVHIGSARYKQRLAAAQASFAGMLAEDSPASGTTGPRLQLHSLLAEPFDSEQLAEVSHLMSGAGHCMT